MTESFTIPLELISGDPYDNSILRSFKECLYKRYKVLKDT